MIISPLTRPPHPKQSSHEGYEWLYVLNGRLRLVLGDNDLTMGPGEAAEFDTRSPHWFGNADENPVEVLSLLGHQGERAHLRAHPPGPASPGSPRGRPSLNTLRPYGPFGVVITWLGKDWTG